MSIPVTKDCGDIWNRLFDHRPYLSGEIKYFIKEFEESRKNREGERLLEAGEWLSDIRDNQIPKAATSLPELQKVNTLLEIALQTSSTVLENEGSFDVDETLKGNRERRKKEWDLFNNGLKEKYAQINKTFSEKEEDLLKFYEDLEKKLEV